MIELEHSQRIFQDKHLKLKSLENENCAILIPISGNKKKILYKQTKRPTYMKYYKKHYMSKNRKKIMCLILGRYTLVFNSRSYVFQKLPNSGQENSHSKAVLDKGIQLN